MATMGKRSWQVIYDRRRDWGLFLEALVWLAWAALLIRFFRFNRLAPLLSPGVRSKLGQRQEDVDVLLKRVRWATTAAARRVPWPAVCFHQGICAQRMLCRRGIVAELCYGVRPRQNDGWTAPNDLEAHVWIWAAGRIVVGGETAASFKEITRFAPHLAD